MAKSSKRNKHSGYNIDFSAPNRANAVIRMRITPKRRNSAHLADTKAKVERDIGRGKAKEMVSTLLQALQAPANLLTQVQAL